MKLGVFLPVSGRGAVPGVLTEAPRQAETLGFDSVWAAERMVNPWEMTTRYPYNAADTWFVPPESPFLETLTALTFLAGVTVKDRAGMSEEQLQIFNLLWIEERPHFEGRYYRFGEVAVNPRPVQQPRFPIWIGGGREAAPRRGGADGGARGS